MPGQPSTKLRAKTMQSDHPFDLPLFQPEQGLWIAPIRHHSPACAWAVRAMIEEVRPDYVLIEGPCDLTPLIDGIRDPATQPPVAAVMLRDGQAVYAPFCAHSPEYVAMMTARKVGATARFIDLPSDNLFKGQDNGSQPVPLNDEAPFDDGDYVRALCNRLDCRDGFELWDHLFETRLGENDWQAFLHDVGAYCAGLRATTPNEEIIGRGYNKREKTMACNIADAMQSGKVVAVVGGFHAPALTHPSGRSIKTPPLKDSYLIRYSHAAMDALSGYAAGLRQPGYYAALWQAAEQANGVPDWRSLTTELIQDFTVAMADKGHPVSLPAKVETLRMAETLASMRGRRAVLRHDLFDGVLAALTKGEVSYREPWSERLRRHWHGSALGSVPRGVSALPLVEDARKRAVAHRLKISDSLTKRRSFDIYRKTAHLATSRFLHAMQLLDTGFAVMEKGPDYANGYGTGLLFEEWAYAWSPLVETRLVELAANGVGDTVTAACLAQIWKLRENDLSVQLQLLGHGIRVGLQDQLTPFVEAFAKDMGRSGSFAEIGQALQYLYALCHTRGPMRPPDDLQLSKLLQAVYARLLYLADDLPHVPEDMIDNVVTVLRSVSDLLDADEGRALDRQLFDDAMSRLGNAKAPFEITGAALALALRAGLLPQEQLVAALQGNFQGAALETDDKAGVLKGMINTAPELLWLNKAIMEAVDNFVISISEDGFLSLLPILRRAFSRLNPRETDRLADKLACHHKGLAGGSLISQFTERDLALGVAAQRQMLEALRQDGLLEEDI
ncbi:DUF5682 family protein [Pseudovibrio sp. Alg231-02]|uniref:DUF5682 family protein n=1 Tax=Pseudovibrio sp. Alg231-02 TaxID=1922223 RepID=UPI00131F353F|nr:DUF5682 family protein [Pseudovibrio sp. Alg231-02]